jgi:hypothetical protein
MNKQSSEPIQCERNQSDGLLRGGVGLFFISIGSLSLFVSLDIITKFSEHDFKALIFLTPFGFFMLALGVGFFRRIADSTRPLLPAWATLTTGLWMLFMGVICGVHLFQGKSNLSGAMAGRGLGALFSIGFLLVLIGVQPALRKHQKNKRKKRNKK